MQLILQGDRGNDTFFFSNDDLDKYRNSYPKNISIVSYDFTIELIKTLIQKYDRKILNFNYISIEME